MWTPNSTSSSSLRTLQRGWGEQEGGYRGGEGGRAPPRGGRGSGRCMRRVVDAGLKDLVRCLGISAYKLGENLRFHLGENLFKVSSLLL